MQELAWQNYLSLVFYCSAMASLSNPYLTSGEALPSLAWFMDSALFNA